MEVSEHEDFYEPGHKRKRYEWEVFTAKPFKRFKLTADELPVGGPQSFVLQAQTYAWKKRRDGTELYVTATPDNLTNSVTFMFYDDSNHKPRLGGKKHNTISGTESVTEAQAQENPERYVQCAVCNDYTERVPNLGIDFPECTERVNPGQVDEELNRKPGRYPLHRNREVLLMFKRFTYTPEDGAHAL